MLSFLCACVLPLQQQLQRLLLLLKEEWPAAVATGLCAFAAQTLLHGLPFLFGCMRDYPSPFAFYSRHLLRLLRRKRSSSNSSNSSKSSSSRWKRAAASSPLLQQQQQQSARRLLGVRHVASPVGEPVVSCCRASSCSSSSRQKVGGRQRTRPPMTLAVDLDETLILATRFKVNPKP